MSEYPNRPLIGVGVVVLKATDGGPRVLLVRRGKAPRKGQWSLPGGRQRLGETVREAARREVAEETGCTVEVAALLDVVDSINRDPPRDDGPGAIAYHYTLVDFLALWRGGEACAGSDAAEVAWVDPAALAPYGLWRETERMIALACERFEADP